MDSTKQHHLRKLPPNTASSHWIRNPDRIVGGFHWCMLPLSLVVMLFLIATLLALTICGFIVTGAGGGMGVSGRLYNEYHLKDYSPWLRKRVEDPKYWLTIRSCILGSKTCRDIVMWSPVDYLTRDMSPIQSGCCKPPSVCNYEMSMMAEDVDCFKWNNDPRILCYECDSCKAGVLEDVRREWRKLHRLLCL